MNEDMMNQLSSLINSFQELIKSQGNIEKNLIKMIEDSENRSIKRSEESESRLNNKLQAFIREVKSDIRDPLKTLLDKHVGQEYLEKKRKGTFGLIQGIGTMILVGFCGTFITIIIDTNENKNAIMQHSDDIKLNSEKIESLESMYYELKRL